MPTIAAASPSFCKSTDLRSGLSALGQQVIFNETGRTLTRPEVIDFFRSTNAKIIVVGLERVDAELLQACPNIEFVAKYGVGLDNIDIPALEAKKVGLGWSPGVNKRSVSEQVLCVALGHRRNIVSSIALMDRGKWIKDGRRLLTGCHVGIVGLGNIGQDLVTLLKPFNCQVRYFDIERKDEFADTWNVEFCDYEELIRWSDILTFHVPSTPLTRGMFGEKQLYLCSSEILVINTARGDIVDFQATVDAVRTKKIAGFAADVFPTEPTDTSAYQSVDGFYFTPHIGGNSREAVSAMGHSAIHHVKEYLLRTGAL